MNWKRRYLYREWSVGQHISKRSLNMEHSAHPTSSLSIPRSRSDSDQSPSSGSSELLSSAIDGLQHDASDLTSRIVELLRNDAQATGNYAIVQ
jgi:hypothetical protein